MISLYGPWASLDHRAGSEVARIDLPRDLVAEIDPERDRCWLDGAWSSGAALLMTARAGRSRLRVVFDRLAPPPSAASPDVAPPEPWLRHHLPPDMASCLRCGRRVGFGGKRGFPLLWKPATPSRRLYSEMRRHLADAGVADLPATPKLPELAGRDHGCYSLPFAGAR